MIDVEAMFTCTVLGTLTRGAHLFGFSEPSGNLELDSSKISHFEEKFLVLKKLESRRKKQILFS